MARVCAACVRVGLCGMRHIEAQEAVEATFRFG